MENGWIKLWRKVKENPIFKNDSLFKCWVYCLLEASHKEVELLISGQIIKIVPGQFISGREKANKDLGWKGIKFDRKMHFLEKHGFLNRQVNRNFTLNTVINWDSYQGLNIEGEQVSEQQVNNDRTTSEQRVNTYKNIKNDKNVKNVLPDVKTFIDFYYITFKEKFGNPPLIQWSKDGAITKRLLKTIPLEELKTLLIRMFESEDQFIQKSGYTIGVFQSQINKLSIKDKKIW